MATGANASGGNSPPRRRVPRYRVQAPLDVTVLRSGIPDTLPGRSVNICEAGVAAVLPGELVPGEAVGVEFHLPSLAAPLRVRASVRHCNRLQCGMEFVGISGAQQTAIRDWASKASGEAEAKVRTTELGGAPADEGEQGGSSDSRSHSKPSGKRRHMGRFMLLSAAVVFAIIFWWRWSRGWEELELGLSPHSAANKHKRVQLPADVVERNLVHRVEPEYPAAARARNLQGMIALDIVIGPDGSVTEIRPLNGPEVLSHAAVDALRWWRFQPYQVDGHPVEVETRVAVEFKNPVLQ